MRCATTCRVRYRLGIILGALNFLLVGFYGWTYQYIVPSSTFKDLESVTYPLTNYTKEQFKSSDRDHHRTDDACHVVHIGMVCAGYNASRNVVTAIKSLVFYQNVLLHVHFIVDPPAKKILGTLFRTWNIPDLTVSFYSIDMVKEKVSWIPNVHYSGIYGLLKLSISDVIPHEIQKIIVLDIDLLFLSDIAQLWDMFAKFGAQQVIGLVEEQSDWYLGNITSKSPWPAVGRGYNTGVMLMDLEKMKKINWNMLWNDLTISALKSYNNTALADQDIVNAVIKMHPNILFALPCTWNVQLSMLSRSRFCYNGDISIINVLHFNAPGRKQTANNPKFLYQYFTIFSIFDSNLLRKPVTKCKNIVRHNDDLNMMNTDLCQNMLDNVSKLRRVHLYFMDFEQKVDVANDVTLVTQLSTDRISMLEMIADRWIGPISFALYISEHETIKLKNFVLNSPSLSIRRNIGYHLVFGDFEDITYPINFLRNIALQEAATDFVFLSDADFVPSQALYHYLTTSILATSRISDKMAYVVPAFEKIHYGNNIPQNKSELLDDWDSGSILPFRSHLWPEAEGHESTNYTKWRYSEEQYNISWVKNYEPFVVLPKSICPKFDKRFFGFGWSKVSHIMELDAAGFEFSVLPHGFIIHMAHFTSPDLHKFRQSKEYKDCVASLKSEFINDLIDKYHINPDKYT